MSERIDVTAPSGDVEEGIQPSQRSLQNQEPRRSRLWSNKLIVSSVVLVLILVISAAVAGIVVGLQGDTDVAEVEDADITEIEGVATTKDSRIEEELPGGTAEDDNEVFSEAYTEEDLTGETTSTQGDAIASGGGGSLSTMFDFDFKAYSLDEESIFSSPTIWVTCPVGLVLLAPQVENEISDEVVCEHHNKTTVSCQSEEQGRTTIRVSCYGSDVDDLLPEFQIDEVSYRHYEYLGAYAGGTWQRYGGTGGLVGIVYNLCGVDDMPFVEPVCTGSDYAESTTSKGCRQTEGCSKSCATLDFVSSSCRNIGEWCDHTIGKMSVGVSPDQEICAFDLPVGDTECEFDPMCVSNVCIDAVCLEGPQGVMSSCIKDSHCQNNACGRLDVDAKNETKCCPTGVSVVAASKKYCGGKAYGELCLDDVMCASGSCVDGQCA